jgi:phosphoglycolate phosphatase-like HAD superfamily hydrolase
MRFDVAVFDFDGTLVQSAEMKRQVFSAIFPSHLTQAVEAVLAADPDASRYIVIPRIFSEAQRLGKIPLEHSVERLIEIYSREAALAVDAAPAMPGAENVLRSFAKQMATYVFSVTPQGQLETLLASRGWQPYISGTFGYPHNKTATVASLVKRHLISPARLLVIGDGESDLVAADKNGCAFFKIARPTDLTATIAYAGIPHA